MDFMVQKLSVESLEDLYSQIYERNSSQYIYFGSFIQGVSGRLVNILGGGIMDYSE